MKHKSKILFILTVLSISLFVSCQQDNTVYSCNPDANAWVKNNMADIRNMTRTEWLNIDNIIYRRAAFVAFSPNSKQQFWLDKIDEVLQLNWNNTEKQHINNLKAAVLNNSEWFAENKSEDVMDKMKLFAFNWADKAQSDLSWTKQQIGSIAFDFGKLANAKGELEAIKKSVGNRLKSASNETYCDCGIDYFWTTCGSLIDGYAEECNNTDCTSTKEGCGFLTLSACDGECELAR